MITVLQNPSNFTSRTVLFKCYYCHGEWLAAHNDYKVTDKSGRYHIYKMHCPFCNREVIKEEIE